MNSTWSALLWKEWREHRLAAALFAGALTATPLAASLWGADRFFAAASIALIAMPVVGIFLAMNIAAREQSTGTIRFLQALPTAGARPAAAKLVAACATMAISVASVVAAAWLWAWLYDGYLIIQQAIETDLNRFGDFAGLENWYAARFLSATILGVSLLLWMAAAGVNRSDEVRAAAIGLLVVLCVWGAVSLLGYLLQGKGRQAFQWYPMFSLLVAAAPGGLGLAIQESSKRIDLWALIGVALVAHAALAAWFIMRFGRVAAGRMQEVAVDAAAPREDRYWMAPPRRSPLSAIAWKQFRESAPLAALGGGSIVALALLFAWNVRAEEKRVEPHEILYFTGSLWAMVGLAVSIVAGVGIFMEDLRPGINGFWRSRPINVDLWFAVKFAAGLAVTLISLAAGAAVVGAFLLGRYDVETLLPDARRGVMIEGMGVGVLFQIGLFTAAVTMMALLRQPVYAVAASIGAGVFLPIAVFATAERFTTLRKLPDAAYVAIGLVLIAAGIVLAWQVVRRDWGWKR